MSLSLIPIVHSDLTKHMGPEPSYIKNNENGIMFRRGDENSLSDVIKRVIENEGLSKLVSRNAFNTYTSLLSPSMAEKLIGTITEHASKDVL